MAKALIDRIQGCQSFRRPDRWAGQPGTGLVAVAVLRRFAGFRAGAGTEFKGSGREK